jgi:hypothetical protein
MPTSNTSLVIPNCFIQTINNANDYIEFKWNATGSVNNTLTFVGSQAANPIIPLTPSVKLSIIQTVYNGPTGPVGPAGPAGINGYWYPFPLILNNTTTALTFNSGSNYVYTSVIGFQTNFSKIGFNIATNSGASITVGIYNSAFNRISYINRSNIVNGYNTFSLSSPVSLAAGDIIYIAVAYNPTTSGGAISVYTTSLIPGVCWGNQTGLTAGNTIPPSTIALTALGSRIGTALRFCFDFV